MHYDILKQPLEIGCLVMFLDGGTIGKVTKHTPKMTRVMLENWETVTFPAKLVRIDKQMEFAKKEWPENFI